MTLNLAPPAGAPGGRAGESASPATRTMRLAEIEVIAEGTSLFVFEPLDAKPLPPARAGAHIDVHLPNGLVRQYSLVLDGVVPAQRHVVAVKRSPDGRGGSRALHDLVGVGATLEIGAPRNNFPLIEDAPHTVLLAGGIGITPILSMIRRLDALGRSYTLHYASQTRAAMAFHDVLSAQPDVELHVDEEAGRVLDVSGICRAAPRDAHLYCCGPAPMLAAFEAATMERSRDHVHVEYFSARRDVASPSAGFTIELARSGLTLPVRPGQSILEVVRGAGVKVLTSCEEGVCGSCETQVLSGVPEHRCEVLSMAEKEAGRTMMICRGRAKSDRLVLDL